MDILVLADDLSGAADCAAASGLPAIVSFNAALEACERLVAVDMDTRELHHADAAARAGAIATRVPASATLYHKMDSTLRGNWPWELGAIAAALAAVRGRRPVAIVCPAFPERGRTILNGKVLVDGAAVAGHSTGDKLSEAGLNFEVLPRGLSASDLRMRIAEAAGQGASVVVCDAEARADLDVIAAASSGMDDLFWCGSAGLMRSIAGRRRDVTPASEFRGRSGCVLVVVGSASPVSKGQLGHLLRQPSVEGVACPADDLLAGNGPALDALASRIAGAALQSRCVAVSISGTVAGGPEAGHALVRALAEPLAPLLPRFGGLVLTGGELARAVLSHAGATGLGIAGEIEPGLPYGWTLGALECPVVTKAGAFGRTDSLTRAVGVLAAAATDKIEEHRA